MSASAAAFAALAMVGQSLGTEPLPAAAHNPADTVALAAFQFRSLDDVDPRNPPLLRRHYDPWHLEYRGKGRVRLYTTARTLPRYVVSIRYVQHLGPAWDRVRIDVHPRPRARR